MLACIDLENWAGSDGEGCAVYEQYSYCSSDGSAGAGWYAGWGTLADFPDQLCASSHHYRISCPLTSSDRRSRSHVAEQDRRATFLRVYRYVKSEHGNVRSHAPSHMRVGMRRVIVHTCGWRVVVGVSSGCMVLRMGGRYVRVGEHAERRRGGWYRR